MRRGILITCAVAALLLGSTDRWADSDTARKHFDAGKRLRDEGDCVRAIPEFMKSLDADKSIGAWYNLGFCHEQLGHRPEAYDAYRRAQQLASAKKDDRLREISGTIASLLEAPHIRLVLPEPLPDGVVLKVDDLVVPATFYATETVVFTNGAKSHSVSVTAPGYEERRETVDTKQVKAIELRRPSEKPTPPGPTTTPKAEPGKWTWQQWSGLGVGVLGAGLVTVASVMLVTYTTRESNLLEKFNVADERCRGGGCSAAQLAERESFEDEYNANEAQAKDNTPIIAATGIGGLLVIATGVVLFVTAPRSSSEKPATSSVHFAPLLGSGTRGAALVGTF